MRSSATRFAYSSIADVLQAAFVLEHVPNPTLVCAADLTDIDVVRHKINGMAMKGRKI